MANNCRKYPKDFAELDGYGVDSALYLPRTSRRIGPIITNKGIQAIKSRRKELNLRGGRGNPLALPEQKPSQKYREGMIDGDIELHEKLIDTKREPTPIACRVVHYGYPVAALFGLRASPCP